MKPIDPKPLAMSFLYGRLEDLEIELKAKSVKSQLVEVLSKDIHNRSMRLFDLTKADPDYTSDASTGMLFAALERLIRQFQLGIIAQVPSIACGNIREAKRHLKLLQSISNERAKLAGIEVIDD